MAPLPTLVLAAYRSVPDADPIALGPVDLTTPFLRQVAAAGGGALPTGLPTHFQVSDVLDGPAGQALADNRLLLPGYVAAAAAFADSLGGLPAVARLRSLHAVRDAARSRRDEAARLLADVSAAIPAPAPGWLYDPYGDVFVPDAGSIYRDWPVEDFLRARPKPIEMPADDIRAWEAAREAHRRAAAPPYAFGTRPDRWEGVAPDTLRELAANAAEGGAVPEIDVHALLDNELEMHFDGSREEVVDEAGLRETVAAWLPHAGSGDATDRALDAALAEFNARQTVVSHHVARADLVLLGGAGKADALAFCERSLARAEARLASALDAWPPAAEA